MRLGAIDVGTNSCRMLVLDIDQEHCQEIKRDLEITRLGEGVDKAGRLSEKAAKRTFATILSFLDEMGKLGVTGKVIIGTSALRDVSNSSILLDRVREETGSVINIINGEEEARLNFLGVGGADSLIIDIGGGSTEFIWQQNKEVVFKSLDMGAVRMTERHILQPHLPVTSNLLEAMEKDIKKLVDQKLAPFIREAINEVIGVGGTITTLGAIDQELENYKPERIEGYVLEYPVIVNILESLSRKDLEQRKKVTGLQPGRADVIIAGTKILQVIMELLEIPQITISEHDLLYGAIKELHLKINGS